MTHLKEIPGFPAYCAAKDGRIWSRKNKQFLRPNLNHGYFFVCLYRDSKSYHKRIHRLILETFIKPCPRGMEACHNNGIRTDNRLENLRWDTRKNNHKDAMKHRTHSCLHQKKEGVANPKAKLKEKDIRIIIYMYKTGLFLQKELAEIYNVCNATISSIITGRTWKHIWSDSKTKLI